MAAALDINDFRKKVQGFLAEAPREVLRINQGLALSVVPMITQRIVNEGKDGTGKKFGSYSTNPLPLFFFTNKSTGSGAEKKIDALVKRKRKQGEKPGISYTEFRQANNLPTSFVTLSFTGETLADIGVVDEVIDKTVVRTTVGARNTKSKAKYNAKGEKVGENRSEEILDFLGERYGDNILSATPAEEKILTDAFDSELQKFIDRYLL